MSGTDYVLTPNLGLYKPLPTADINAWGGHLNSNADTLDAALYSVQTAAAGGPFLPLAGGTVSGATTFNTSITSPLMILTPTVSFSWVSSQIVASQPFASSQIVAGRGLTNAPASAAISPVVNGNISLGGTVTGQSDIYRFAVSGDNAAGTAGVADGLIKTVGIYSNINGAAINRGRAGLWVAQSVLTGPTVPGLEMLGGSFSVFCSNTNAAYTPYCQPLVSAGGVMAGSTTGSFSNEFDYYAAAGAVVGTKQGLQITLSNGDKVRGAGNDAGLSFSNSNAFAAASPGMQYVIMLGNSDQAFPVSTADGTIFGVRQQTGISGTGRSAQMIPAQCANGFNLSNVYFTGAAFQSGGFLVDGLGQISSGNASLLQNATGMALDVNKQIVTAVAVAVGGIATGAAAVNAYYAGDVVYDALGDVFTVSGVSAGLITGLTIRAAATAASPPVNPVTLNGGSGTGATVNLTWSAGSRNGLSLNPTGQHIGFNGTAPIAKPAFSGAKGGNAALASVIAALVAYGLGTDTTTA